MINTKASAVSAPTPGCVCKRCAAGHFAPLSVLDCLLFGSQEQRGDEHGELVWNRKAIEEGTGPSGETVVGVECGHLGLCRCVRRSETETPPHDVREGPSKDRSRTESTLGSLEGEAEESLAH